MVKYFAGFLTRVPLLQIAYWIFNPPIQLMRMVRRRVARSAQELGRWSGKEEDANRNPKRIAGKWTSSTIRNLIDKWIYVALVTF